jgi:uncharacterized metal-binding protein YceD (DUF177 family)
MTDHEFPNYSVNVVKLPKLGLTIKLVPNDREVRAIAAHLEVESVEKLSAQLVFRPWARDGVKVEVEVNAALHTQCPVTLEGVQQTIHASIDAKFAPSSSKLAKPQLNVDGEMVLDVDSDDIPDIYEGENLDAWAIALEYLLLEIDFFARREGAQFDHSVRSDSPNEEESSPFAVLGSLKK